MGHKSTKKLYFRTILFTTFSLVVLYDFFFDKNTIDNIIDYKIFDLISILHIFWIYLIIEMFIIIIPRFNIYSYNGKHLLKHYIAEANYDKEKLRTFTKLSRINALKSAIFWILLNIPFAILYLLGYLDRTIMYWLFFFYYFADTFCINIFCLFHFALIKSKCCNECRIYNWSYFMYATPLLFMPNIWNYIVVILSVIILIWWEASAYLHPERFSSISNKILQCDHCPHTCRYKNKNKLENIITGLLKKLGFKS